MTTFLSWLKMFYLVFSLTALIQHVPSAFKLQVTEIDDGAIQRPQASAG
jgi:hypothetical protein